eukprot:107538-Amphidinium_carterae.1
MKHWENPAEAAKYVNFLWKELPLDAQFGPSTSGTIPLRPEEHVKDGRRPCVIHLAALSFDPSSSPK